MLNLPFTLDQFLAVFEQYNRSVWPFQIVLNASALAAVLLAVRQSPSSSKIICGILSFFWLWIGTSYHLAHFTSINPAAYLFGALNILQGLVFLYHGILKSRLTFCFRRDLFVITGCVFVIYSLVLYPILGSSLGHSYPKAPTFGLPCPTTIFTFGMLLWTTRPFPRTILVVPFLWSLVGFSAALTMGILEDIGLLVAGVVASLLILIRDKRPGDPAAAEGTT